MDVVKFADQPQLFKVVVLLSQLPVSVDLS